MTTATLLVSCADQRGLVARLAGFIANSGGNILHADQHIDLATGLFLMRAEWDIGPDAAPDSLRSAFAPVAEAMGASWEIHFSGAPVRAAIWVTRQEHCLLDLIWRWRAGELPVEITAIVSNHPDLESQAASFGIDYHHFPMSGKNRPEQERRQLELMRKLRIDLVILAKYMQILSPAFVEAFPRRILNIHHSFLPAFAGASPYHRAYERGVKIIGATAHYVTAEIDEGPIIEQDIVRISHRDNVPDLVRKGKDLERIVLARAVRYHLENRVLVYGNKTVVFA
jgi:formyltetrahydrofolate deformylase